MALDGDRNRLATPSRDPNADLGMVEHIQSRDGAMLLRL